MMMKMKNNFALLLLVTGVALAQPNPKDSSVTFVAASPSAPSCSAGVNGSAGSTTIYYWPVANYPGGQAIVSNPLVVANAPNTLSGANFVIVSCNLPPYATTLDLLKSSSPSMSVQGTCTNCAIGTGSTTGQFNDQANVAPSPYTFNFNTAKYAVVRLNTRDFSTARLEFSIGPDPINGGGTFGPLPATSGGSGGFGSSAVFTNAANVTVANVNAGFNLVPGVAGHTLKVNHFYIAARGGAAATCTDVRLGDSNNANAIVIDPVANLTSGTGNTEGTSTIAQSGFGATAFASGLGINIFKSGSSCATVTSFDTVVQYTII